MPDSISELPFGYNR